MIDEKHAGIALIVGGIAALSTIGGLLTLKSWQQEPRLAVAALIFGLIGGFSAYPMNLDFLAPIFTFVGAATGGAAFQFLNQTEIGHRIAAAIMRKFGIELDGKTPPKDEGDE
jgi:hypothetical protein